MVLFGKQQLELCSNDNFNPPKAIIFLRTTQRILASSRHDLNFERSSLLAYTFILQPRLKRTLAAPCDTPANPAITMSDAKPTATEPQMANLSLSSETPAKSANGTDPAASSFTPRGKINWADDEETVPNTASDNTTGAKAADDTLEKAQTDGASTWMHGSVGLDEPEFDVNVKLADLQANPDNPLYSVKTFEELNL